MPERLPFLQRHSTPAYWLRWKLGRCDAGPWLCWRKACNLDDERAIKACTKHFNTDVMKLERYLRRKGPWPT